MRPLGDSRDTGKSNFDEGKNWRERKNNMNKRSWSEWHHQDKWETHGYRGNKWGNNWSDKEK
eukprot:4093212-Karenia_brevis.AAC.1